VCTHFTPYGHHVSYMTGKSPHTHTKYTVLHTHTYTHTVTHTHTLHTQVGDESVKELAERVCTALDQQSDWPFPGARPVVPPGVTKGVRGSTGELVWRARAPNGKFDMWPASQGDANACDAAIDFVLRNGGEKVGLLNFTKLVSRSLCHLVCAYVCVCTMHVAFTVTSVCISNNDTLAINRTHSFTPRTTHTWIAHNRTIQNGYQHAIPPMIL
jgi:hypothetical protein